MENDNYTNKVLILEGSLELVNAQNKARSQGIELLFEKINDDRIQQLKDQGVIAKENRIGPLQADKSALSYQQKKSGFFGVNIPRPGKKGYEMVLARAKESDADVVVAYNTGTDKEHNLHYVQEAISGTNNILGRMEHDLFSFNILGYMYKKGE